MHICRPATAAKHSPLRKRSTARFPAARDVAIAAAATAMLLAFQPRASVAQIVPAQPSSPPAIAAPTPTPLPTPLVLPPDAAPVIVAYALSTTVLYAGENVTGNVVTSTNVASVELRIEPYSLNLPRTDYGQFAIALQVPSIPWMVRRGAYTLRLIARNARGDATELDVPVTLN